MNSTKKTLAGCHVVFSRRPNPGNTIPITSEDSLTLPLRFQAMARPNQTPRFQEDPPQALHRDQQRSYHYLHQLQPYRSVPKILLRQLPRRKWVQQGHRN